MIAPLSPLTPARRPNLPFHHLRPADLLVQRRLPDDHVDVWLALAKDRLLAGQRRLDDSVPRVVVRQGRIGFGQRPCVVHGLQQRGYPLGFIDQNFERHPPRGGGSPARRRAEHRRTPRTIRERRADRPWRPGWLCCWSSMPYSVSSSRSSLPRMPRCPVSILLIFDRSHSRTRAASSSV